MRRLLPCFVLAFLSLLVIGAHATTVGSLNAQHRFGQTFVVWTAPPGAGWRYRVYRSAAPITVATDLNAAALLGSVGDSTGIDRRLSQLRGQTFAYRLDSLAAELAATQAIFVVTPSADRVSYYAVTAQAAAGAEDRTVMPGANALTGPVTEFVSLTRPIFQRTLVSGTTPFDVYTTFANPEDTPLVAAMAAAHGFAFDHAVVRGTLGGPLQMRPHARGGSFLSVLGGSGEPGEWRVALDDHLYRSSDRNSFWYGYHDSYDLELANPITPLTGLVRAYTLHRVLHTFAWARRELPVDTTRVIASGGSMGGIGSLRLAFGAPNWLAGIHIVVPKFDFSFTNDPNPANAWNAGAPERSVGDHLWGAVPTDLPTDDGIPVYDRLNDGVLAARMGPVSLPYIVAFNGRNDTVVGWAEKIGYYAAAQLHHSGGTYYWDTRNHAGAGAGWTPMQDVRRLYRLRTNRSYPAFSNASSDDEPGGGALTSGDSLGTINGYLDWDSTLVDRPDLWECTILRRSLTSNWGLKPAPATIAVDVTPRRLQQFRPNAGEMLQWQVRRVDDGAIATAGLAQVDALGLVTLPQVPVSGNGARLSVFRPGTLEVGAPTIPIGMLWTRTLRNPARGHLDLAIHAAPGFPLSMELHDLAGRLLRNAASQSPTAMMTILRWELAGVEPGLYFVTIRQGAQTASTRVTVLR